MSSQQLRRENVTDEQKVDVEKDKVPKMTSHFEALATHAGDDQSDIAASRHEGKSHGSTVGAGKVDRKEEVGRGGRTYDQGRPVGGKIEVHTVKETGPAAATQMGMKEAQTGKSQSEEQRMHKKAGGETEKDMPSLEEVTKMRQQAQQNSMDAIRAAQERSHKASKESGAGATSDMTAEKAGQAREAVMQGAQTAAAMAGQARETVNRKLGETAQAASEKAGQAKESVKQGFQVASEKGAEAKESAKGGVQSGTEYVTEKGQQGYSAAAETAKQAKDYAAETAIKAKDTTADVTSKTASYVGEKAAAAKDATVETGKTAAGYEAKAAVGAKDMATVAAWGTAHYTAEMAAEATKTMANVAAGVAGFAGDKAVAAKDMVTGAGQTAVHYAGDKLAGVKDTIVSAEESAAEYSARKKAEAQRNREQKQSAPPQAEEFMDVGSCGGQETKAATGGGVVEGFSSEQTSREVGKTGQGEGGVLQAMGETIVEIGQTTKDLLVGQDQNIFRPSQSDESEEKGRKGNRPSF